ncbi:MAG: ABC1 kinase family protein [Bdellovibrionales bacterium]
MNQLAFLVKMKHTQPVRKKPETNDIPTGRLVRSWSVARAAFGTGRLFARQWWSGDKAGDLSGLGEIVVKELGKLKGTAMKVGQTLSVYGEAFLPKEAVEVLKNLQQNTPPVSWTSIESQLLAELGKEKLERLSIEPQPLAAASIGQVYRAQIRNTGETVAVKVQYPGVASAVDADLTVLRTIFKLTGAIPSGPRLDQIFAEIREMFTQEIDFRNEMRFQGEFADKLKDDHDLIIPPVFAELSGTTVLTTGFIEGHRIDAPQVQALSLERRNRIGMAFLRLYLRELLEFHLVQTDPHAGNYLVQIGEESDRLVLLDFGAVRSVPEDFLRSYVKVIRGSLDRNARLVEEGGRGLGLLQPEDRSELVQDYVRICYLITEPFATQSGSYDWGTSDLPKRVAQQAIKLSFSYKLRAPPRELVFLDRKLGGVFMFLSALKCEFSGRGLIEEALVKAGF